MLARSGKVLPILQATCGGSSTVKQFILQNGQGGVYTTARCTADNRVFELQSHLDRIVGGLKQMFPNEYKYLSSVIEQSSSSDLEKDTMGFFQHDQSYVDTYLSHQIRLQMRSVAEEFPADPCRITIVGHSPQLTDIDTHAASSIAQSKTVHNVVSFFPISVLGEHLPPPPKAIPSQGLEAQNCVIGGVPVVVRVCSRENPNVKDSSFVAEREKFEQTKGVCNEVLLASLLNDETTVILEGGSSNFFALYNAEHDSATHDGSTISNNSGESRKFILRTACEDQVLSGTVRKLVLEVTKNLSEHGKIDVKVEENAPDLSEIDKWAGCFVTSTSRLVLPIDRVVVPVGILKEDHITGLCAKPTELPLLTINDVDNSTDHQHVFKFDLSDARELQAIQQGVEDAILSHSTLL